MMSLVSSNKNNVMNACLMGYYSADLISEYFNLTKGD